MGFTRREFLAFAGIAAGAQLAGCSKPTEQKPTDPEGQKPASDVDLDEFKGLAVNMDAWKYDEDNDCYYQLGLAYCKKPATKTYESLAIFVPGQFFTGEKNGDSYKCTVNDKAVVGNFTPATAPVLMPINTGTLAAQLSPTAYEYNGLGTYLEKGFVYVYAGFRGRSAGVDTSSGSSEMYPGGAPWPVVDLKAAVRFLRYNASQLPFDADRVFMFGFSAGGGVSAVLGASGDSEAFNPYLEQIGAATHDAEGNKLSDALAGSASWCPVTSPDTADAAYEWAMGQYSSDESRADGTWRAQLSGGLAAAYGDWVNGMDLRNSDDEQLMLEEAEKAGIDLDKFCEDTIYEFGLGRGKKYGVCEGNPGKMAEMLYGSNGQDVFEMELAENTDERGVLKFHFCPLAHTWKAMGLPAERVAELCRLACYSDFARADCAGVNLHFENQIGRGDEICELVFTPRKDGDPSGAEACRVDCAQKDGE